MYRSFFKRAIDVLIASIILLLASPLILFTFIALYIANKGKAFFVQERPGKDGRIFKIVKFKSMNDKKGPDGKLLPDGDRITPFGKFVRKSSLDELPQLFNVLKGDMSLIGPRPLLVAYLDRYTPDQRKRHLVRPGITGWAQVNGRNAISWDKKFEYDVWYVDHVSFVLDTKIFFMTITKVFERADISASDNATMEEFMGNP